MIRHPIKTKEELVAFLFNEMTIRVLKCLKNNSGVKYGQSIGYEVRCTYAHIHQILTILENAELVVSVKNGRMNVIKLTDKGLRFANAIEGAIRLL